MTYSCSTQVTQLPQDHAHMLLINKFITNPAQYAATNAVWLCMSNTIMYEGILCLHVLAMEGFTHIPRVYYGLLLIRI